MPESFRRWKSDRWKLDGTGSPGIQFLEIQGEQAQHVDHGGFAHQVHGEGRVLV